ncbi:MAG: nucleotidyl transferase AbiEii/AbiGii toxin family protein [Opitutaceae bacterium]|nr:nucleotidyl transferase AbiEii/AbiGii toxin family protein [Opitutaceae bacterium]
MRETRFFKQADLLVQVMPFVNTEACFALKGGTAINFFVRDFPRLSVDIDLVYLPLEDRPTTLRGIAAALQHIAVKIRRAMPGVQVREHHTVSDKLLVKLTVRAADGAEVKIEPNTVLRGTLHPTAELNLSSKAVELFGRSATMRVVSLSDLFGSKLCAALDRQHPRDLFDVHGLFQAEGITDEIRRAFVVFLASHDRPMSELLAPNRKDLKQVFADQFEGMTLDPVPLAVLADTRERLIERINADLTAAEREFLLSMKRLEPKWELLGLPGVERLPGPQWKLYNLRKMDATKRRAAEEQLRKRLGL